ncbi:YfcC family protein [Flintibacter faecis]|uniref:YfcC family protein n=1 Tax=Flintibacter faecis TaxID=2763047 RepID=A0A8J6M193_9FIRM|nr:TIGR00366 family protein [Flintibacter faecis]MBC5716204.1 YfcC family protein [Flintibacter faecis]
MSSGNMLKKKKGIQLPHIYVLLFSVIIVCTILTWVLPAGEFDRVMNEATGRTVAVAGTFHTVKQSPVGIFQMFQSIYNGMCDAGSVTFFVFVSFASINIIIASGAFNGLVAGLLKVFKGKARVAIIPIFMFIVGIASSTIGLFEEWFPFVPVFAGIAMAMGFDAVVGMAIVAFGAATGYSGAMMNPFTVGIAQGIAEVAPMSGTGYRFLCHMALLVVGSALTIRYALKVQADPSKSLVYGETGHITMSENDVQNSPFGIREKLVLLILLGGIIAVVYGCKVYGWYFAELSAVFVIMGVLSALVMGWGPNKIGELYSKGFTDIAMACMMIGLARGILMVLQAGNIIDTVVYYFSLPLAAFPSWFCGVAMLVMQTLLNFFIPSGSGQAAASMPIMAPLADLLGVSRDTAVLAFQFGDGLSNVLWPTAYPAILAGLAGIKVEKWWKFAIPVGLALVLTQAGLMILAVLTGFGA